MKKKMNTLYAIDHDLNYISHVGVPGMSWHKHKFGKWQSQAVYAQGMTNPDAKEKKGLKGAVEKAKNAVSDAVTRHQAKNDAAITAMDKYGGKTKGARRLATGKIASGVAGAAAGVVTGGSAGRAVGEALNSGDMRKYGRQFNQASIAEGKMENYISDALHRGVKLSDADIQSLREHGRVANAVGGIGKYYKGPESLKKQAQYGLGQARQGIESWSTAGAAVGAAAGASIGAHLYKASTMNGYIKRASGTLKNTTMSPRRQEVYRQTYDKYLKQYSQATKVNWGKVY